MAHIAVGIDLGTTNSALAWVNQSGRTEMIRNAEGDLVTPSVVWFTDEETIVGKEARSAAATQPDQVAQWVKRDMGAKVYRRPIRGESLPPEVIQACILRKLKADLDARLKGSAGAVITVPAYFDETRRKATSDAGEMAGLTVVDIVNEPTAAALAFGETQGFLSRTGKVREEMTILVYDLGGGTFDATVLRLAPGDVRTLATDGDVQLGGYDWDMRLVDYVAECFKQSHGVDPREDAVSLGRLIREVTEAKHTLSARGKATVQVACDGRSDKLTITREDFEELTADLLDRTAYTSRQLLKAAELDWPDVSRVLLVGGSTRMPMVSTMIEKLSGLTPDHTVNPDEAVARGAALYARYLLGKQGRTTISDARDAAADPAFEVTNVNAHSLGVEGIEPATMRKANIMLIPRNTPLPAKFTKTFTTKRSGQTSIVVKILEGESSSPDDCSMIGHTVVRDLPPDLPKGCPIQVTFAYGSNGRLAVQTVLPGRKRSASVEIERELGLSSEGVARWKQVVSPSAAAASAGFDAFQSLVNDALGLASGGESDTMPEGQSQAEGSSVAYDPSDKGPPPAPPAPPTSPQPPGRPKSPNSSPDVAALAAPDVEPNGAIPFQPVGSRWMLVALGYAASVVVGLGAGYLIVSWLFPQVGLPRLW